MNKLFSWINNTFSYLFTSYPEVERTEEVVYMPKRYIVNNYCSNNIWRICIYCKERRDETIEICPGCGAWSHTLHSAEYSEWSDRTWEQVDIIVIKKNGYNRFIRPDDSDYEQHKGVPAR